MLLWFFFCWIFDPGFDDVIREEGRLVIVVIQNEIKTSSRAATLDLDHAMKELPGEVLIAKVVAERNPKLVSRLRVTKIPAIHVYRGGNLLRKFDPSVHKDDFLAYVNARLRDKPSDYNRDKAPDIRPMNEDWLPPGVEKKTSSSDTSEEPEVSEQS